MSKNAQGLFTFSYKATILPLKIPSSLAAQVYKDGDGLRGQNN